MSSSIYRFGLVLSAVLLLSLGARAQFGWQQLTLPSALSRYDDMYWRSPQLGWTIDYGGRLHKTSNGGQTWQALNGPSGQDYRSVAFLTDQLGFLGKLTAAAAPPDTFALYRTADGGQSWAGVALPGPVSARGFCGMSVVNDSVMMACGRFEGPPAFYRTTTAGQTWQTVDMSAYAGGLVDCYFWSADSGIVVGCTGGPVNSYGIVLGTTDGGATWAVRHQTANLADLCWKISFPSRRVGYVSIEDFNGGDQFCLKTTDQGLTWTELKYANNIRYNAEGIGFINDSVGWIGGDFFSAMYSTVDGGQIWTRSNIAPSINRFRFFGDTLGYASGKHVYRITPQSVGLPGDVANDALGTAYPNPATRWAQIPVTLRLAGPVTVRVADALGREVARRTATYAAGPQQVELPVAGLPGGLYFCRISTPEGEQVRRLVVAP